MSDTETYEDGKQRVHRLYATLIEELTIGQNTLLHELDKPVDERDTEYIIGQTRLNVALENAVLALEQSGAIDEDLVRSNFNEASVDVRTLN